MELKAGQRLACPGCDTEVVVVRPPTAQLVLTCGGATLVAPADRDAGGAAHEDAAEPVRVGKRYVDETSGIELLCSKAGAGMLAAEGRVVTLKDTKPLPSSD